MPDFLVVAQPTSVGNTCALCNTHRDDRGFVNLNFDVMGYGRLHCCAGCADQIGRAVGGLDPQQASRLHGIADELGETAERLQAELAAEKLNKVVPLNDVASYFNESYPIVAEVAQALKDKKLVFLDDHRPKQNAKPKAS
jgi:hypothetical protein